MPRPAFAGDDNREVDDQAKIITLWASFFFAFSARALARARHLRPQRGDALAERFRPQRSAEVARAPLWAGDRAIERILDGRGRAREALVVPALAEPVEQHCRRADQGGRVGAVLSGDVGRRAMLGLRQGVRLAGVERGGEPRAA